MHVDARIEHRILNVRTAVIGISIADDLLVLPLDHWRLLKSGFIMEYMDLHITAGSSSKRKVFRKETLDKNNQLLP